MSKKKIKEMIDILKEQISIKDEQITDLQEALKRKDTLQVLDKKTIHVLFQEKNELENKMNKMRRLEHTGGSSVIDADRFKEDLEFSYSLMNKKK